MNESGQPLGQARV